MKLKLMGIAAIVMIACLVTPASAEEKTAARKVLVKEKNEAGLVISETGTETSQTTTTITVGGQTADKIEEDKEEKEKVTEVQSVNAEGHISGARVSYNKSKKSHAEQDFGAAELGEAAISTGDLEGAVIAWAFDAEKKAWSGKLEKGEDNKGTKKALTKKEPFKVPFIPGKEVAVGETWEIADKDLRDFFADDEAMKVNEIKASCTAEEIIAGKGGECLKVTFVIDIKATLQNEDLKNPEVTAKITGHYMFNIGTSLCDSVELNSELSFSSEATGRGGEKIPFTVKMKGQEIMTLTYKKAEKGSGK
ncbi:hypothetical protein PLCT2_01610 [Planctomycetaceae bacterium]|nr:hypothetical protein PLCT2_01610 [Planctomycetaceae bacterium]